MLRKNHKTDDAGFVRWALLALALGGFGIGTGEFIMMGLLPDVSRSLAITEPQAGNAIASYAMGVVVGAPFIAVLAARMARKSLLLILMALFSIGNVASAMAESYHGLLVARFLTGLPHGAYFGVASLVAASLVPIERRGRALASLMLGLTVATLIGVPLGSWIGQLFSWHVVFTFVGAIGLLTCLLIGRYVPYTPGDVDAHPLRELGALKNAQVLLTLLVGAVGFGGMFAIFSYIAPTLINIAGISPSLIPSLIPWAMVAFGLGMIIGNLVGGRLADGPVLNIIGWTLLWNVLVMLAFPVLVQHVATGLLATFLIGTCSVLLPSLQIRLMDVANESQTLAAAMNHSALNIANAMGAYLGGLTVSLGYGWISTAWVGVALGVAGLMVFVLTARHAARQQTQLA
ncbi:MFS transporter [Pantoea agglomerans]|uniref:MFS transporter n=1 Tax=Enterobacter agglomerans TaxID=549 RepID=UPI00277F4C16|nr:MFS transporter [Pantoea agglomerans]MDQ0434996.1 DHA1 family inner membrane transport protein [Pantoea agglomerans]